jgi:hypothetical protein
MSPLGTSLSLHLTTSIALAQSLHRDFRACRFPRTLLFVAVAVRCSCPWHMSVSHKGKDKKIRAVSCMQTTNLLPTALNFLDFSRPPESEPLHRQILSFDQTDSRLPHIAVTVFKLLQYVSSLHKLCPASTAWPLSRPSRTVPVVLILLRTTLSDLSPDGASSPATVQPPRLFRSSAS